MRQRDWVGLAAATVTSTLAYVSLLAFETYGVALFVVSPLLMGFTGVMAASRVERRPMRSDLWLSAACGLAPYLLAWMAGVEGALCLMMFLPLAFPLAMFGGAIAHWLAEKRKLVALIVLPPMLGSGEAAWGPSAPVVSASTAIEINAPPSIVWKNIISFTELPPPNELIFRAGVAFPVRAEMEGVGVGAVRRCIFSTGAVIEPITVWDEPRTLAFGITEQPPTMREMSPYDIEPPHLEGYFVSHRGQFELVPLARGRTLLKGTSWYSNRMWPAPYWRLWTDHIMHSVHGRVMGHIRARSEATHRRRSR